MGWMVIVVIVGWMVIVVIVGWAGVHPGGQNPGCCPSGGLAVAGHHAGAGSTGHEPHIWNDMLVFGRLSARGARATAGGKKARVSEPKRRAPGCRRAVVARAFEG